MHSHPVCSRMAALSIAEFPSRLASTIILGTLCFVTRGAVGQEVERGDIVRSAATQAAASYHFSEDDEQLLDEIQRGCFEYLWREVDPSSGLVRDRRFVEVCSIAGVGFQLSALPIGVERGWITQEQGRGRALAVLRTLTSRDDNRKFGVFLHFVDLQTGGILAGDRSDLAGTVDHALFLAGAIPAAEYFGGEVAEIVNEIIDSTNWKAFDVSEKGLISFGWRAKKADLQGPGDFVEWDWHLASDEELIVYFLAAGAPRAALAGEARDYYRLERNVKQQGDMPPYVVSWNGSMFTYFFAHCWIDYRSLAADDPAQFGVENPRVDWFENSRRATLSTGNVASRRRTGLRRSRKIAGDSRPAQAATNKATRRYLVQSLRPSVMDEDVWEGGTVAPYAAGTAIMFTPAESMAALRAYRMLTDKKGQPLVWRDPATGGYGMADSFNVEQQAASEDNVAIDVGPMLLAIENVRTGLIWRLFMQHAVARRAVERLMLKSYEP